MIRVVRRYGFEPGPKCVLQVPGGARLIRVGDWEGEPSLWLDADDDAPTVGFLVMLAHTDEPLRADDCRYAGSFSVAGDSGGEEVIHAFLPGDIEPRSRLLRPGPFYGRLRDLTPLAGAATAMASTSTASRR
ncbi:MAG: hypothetical protein AB7I38_16805 [Dehalococcoidia bacterium]